MNYTLTLLVPPDFHWSSKTSGPLVNEGGREKERESIGDCFQNPFFLSRFVWTFVSVVGAEKKD